MCYMKERPQLLNPFERAVQAGPDWVSRKEQLLERFSDRVDRVSVFMNGVMGVSSELNLDETEQALHLAYRKALTGLPVEARKGAMEYERFKRLAGLLDAEQDLITPQTDPRIVEEHFALRDSYEKSATALEEDPDIALFVSLGRVVTSLLEKRKTVLNLGYDHERLIAAFARARSSLESFPVDGAQRIDVGCFDISVYASMKEVQRISADVSGLHFSGTPFNLIGLFPDQHENPRTLRHERVHNYIDQSPHHEHQMPADALSRCFAGNKISSRFVSKLNPRTFLDGLHNELLAQMENAEDHSFVFSEKLHRVRDQNDVFYRLLGKQKSTARYSAGESLELIFSTAGGQVRKLRDLRKRLLTLPGSAEVLTDFDHFHTSVDKRFLAMGSVLRESFCATALLPDPEEAHDVLVSACVLLKPSQYERVLPSYLDRRFGVVQMESARQWNEVFSEGIQSPAGLKVIEALLQKGPIPERAMARACEELLQLATTAGDEIESAIGFKLRDLKKIRTYIRSINKVASRIGLSGSDVDEVRKHFIYEHCFYFLSDHVESGFSGLQKKMKELQDDERASMQFAFEIYSNFISEDINPEGTLTKEDAMRLPHWDQLKQAGFLDEIALLRQSVLEGLVPSLSEPPSSSGS